jgi:hypothetical protein
MSALQRQATADFFDFSDIAPMGQTVDNIARHCR